MDDLGERGDLGRGALPARVVVDAQLAGRRLELDAAFERERLVEVGQLDLTAQVEGVAAVAPDESRQGTRVDVVALHRRVLEAHHLGEEGVDPDEGVETVAEVLAPKLFESVEALHSGRHQRVDAPAQLRRLRREERDQL